MAGSVDESAKIDAETEFQDEIGFDGASENEEDLIDIPKGVFKEILVTPTDWTVETILAQLNRGNIDLMPRFQRRDAWGIDKKSKFIESLFLGLPVPQLVLAEVSRGSFIVIDGKQRLSTLRQFSAPEGDSQFPPFSMRKLEYRSDLNGKFFHELDENSKYSDDVNHFLNTTIRTVVIRNWKDERILYLLFLRLNQYTVMLSPQELRQALHPGHFINFVDEYSAKSVGLKLIFSKTPDFRMRDVELLIRYFGFQKFGNMYNGNMKKFLDDTTRLLNKSWGNRKEDIESLTNDLEEAIDVAHQIFRKDVFRKYKGKKFEGRTNRAVIDIILYYFSNRDIRKDALNKRKEVKDAFISLCKNNHEFIESLERTTKSLGATHARFSIWAEALGDALGRVIESPIELPG